MTVFVAYQVRGKINALTNLENRIDIQFCDVVDACVSEKNSQLDEKVSKLSVKDRKTVYDVLDLLIRDMTK